MPTNITIICFLFISLSISAQQGDKISFGYSASHLIKLGNRNTFAIPDNPTVQNIAYSFPNLRSSDWQQYWKYPQIGVHLFALDMDDPKVLGYVYGVLPSLEFKIMGDQAIGFHAKFGTGLSFATKTYHKLYNPSNNAIGSHFNNISHFGLDFRVKLLNHNASIGYQLTHISNARTATPNTGFNLHGWQLTFSRNTLVKRNFNESPRKIDTIQRWGGDILLGYGVSEYSFTGGSKYGTYWVSSGLKYSWNNYIAATIGVEYEYNENIFQFHKQDFDIEEIAQDKATQTSVFLAQYLRFGYLAIRLQGGFYLPYPDVERTRHPNYLRVGVDIHPLNGRYRFDPYIGVSLKSHKAVAQYLGLYSGVMF